VKREEEKGENNILLNAIRREGRGGLQIRKRRGTDK